jgi:putative hydrolase of the HAD superfamily
MSVPVRVVFFDIDFTLIRPGRAFHGEGYRDFCARHGIDVDPKAFDRAVVTASATLDVRGGAYDPAVFVDYTARIIEAMGGRGPQVPAAARDIYDEWASCRHFSLYDEVPEVLRALKDEGFSIGLISNTQRSMLEFERHFALEGMFTVAIASSDHGYMKPHPSIFEEALRRVGARPAEAVMVGDSVPHDIVGAHRAGMRAILVARSGLSRACPPEVPVIRSLRELRQLL